MPNPLVYSGADFATSLGVIDPEDLRGELDALSLSTAIAFIDTRGGEASVHFDAEPSSADEAAVAAAIAAHGLARIKRNRLAAIDARTEELIQSGFQHAGKIFSLSANAQIKWMGAYTLSAFFTAASAYPLTVNTQNDLDTYDVVDEADLAAIWQKVGVSVLTILGGDTALKSQVRAATTGAEVDAVEDTR